MDSILTFVFGTFGIGVITAVFAFSRERLNKADEQIKDCRDENRWYRDKLLPALEHQQDVLEKQQRLLEFLQRRIGGNDNS